MESQSTQTIKLLILQPGEYDLWKIRMEQYLQCIDYTLWEIIQNGNAPIVTKTVVGKETVIPPTSVKQKAQRRTELKAISTFLMALPSEHQLKFNLYKDAMTLMNKAEIETLSLDDLFNNLKAYESEVKGTSSSTINSHNAVFLSSSSTNSATRAVNDAQGINTASTQDNKDLQQINPDDLKEMELRWNIAMLTMRAKRFLKNTGRKLDMANKERIRAPRNQDSINREPTRRTVLVEETISNALVSQCHGFGYDWSNQAVEGPTNIALMAYSSTSSTSSTNSEIMDKCKIGLGYNTVPPPYTGNFMPPESDLVYPSLDDFVDVNESVVEKPIVETNEPETSRKENGAPIIEDWVSDSDEENMPKVKTVEMFDKPSFAKINFVKSTQQVKYPRKTSIDKNRQNTPSPRGNKRNWNQQMSQKLKNDFEMFNKACHVCGSFDHLKNDCNNYPKRNIVPRTVLTRSGPILVNVVRPVNTVQSRTAVNNAGPMKNVINNACSTTRRPFNKITAANNNNVTKKVNTVKGKRVNTARPKAVLSVVNGNALARILFRGLYPDLWISPASKQDSIKICHSLGDAFFSTNTPPLNDELFQFLPLTRPRENTGSSQALTRLNGIHISFVNGESLWNWTVTLLLHYGEVHSHRHQPITV
ncbi:hypothetical protein Tco_0871277 [Tanacetum coccineum]